MKWALIAVGVLVGLMAIVAIVGTMLPRDHVAGRPPRRAAGPPPGLGAHGAPTKQSDIPTVVDISEPPHRLVTRIADETLPFGGSWEFLIEPDGANASRVTITEHGSVYNPVFRFVSRFIMGHTATLDGFLKTLAKRFG
jgi:hypothetical protein